MRPRRLLTQVVGMAVLALPAAAQAPLELDVPTRLPATGLAILDCAPPAPAPADSCVLRMPPGWRRDALRATPPGSDAGSSVGAFDFVRSEDARFPDEVDLSVTLLLVDLTPGLNNGRKGTFAREKALIRGLVERLPPSEPLAIYTFDETLRRLSDFSTTRAAHLAVIDSLELQGSNTRIGTQTRAAIDVLAGQDDVLLRNLLLVTDGEEEGIGTLEQVIDAAVDANVSVSSLGTFWRPVGAPEVGRSIDFLSRLAEGTLGGFEATRLRQPDEASAAVARLAANLTESLRESGLILPDGAPTEALIRVTLEEPPGAAPDSGKLQKLDVSFLPEPGPQPRPIAEAGWRQYLDQPWWAWVSGALVMLTLAALGFWLLRQRTLEEAPAVEPAEPAEPVAKQPPAAVPDPATRYSAPVRAWAYLVRQDTGERIALSAQRAAIGRSSANVVVLADDSISRVHAELHRNREGGVSVTDMDSLNGTWVNDGRVHGTRPIGAGDMIRFGDVRVRLVLA